MSCIDRITRQLESKLNETILQITDLIGKKKFFVTRVKHILAEYIIETDNVEYIYFRRLRTELFTNLLLNDASVNKKERKL